MLLVSIDRVDRSLPKESIARISSSGAPLLGIVTNALKPERQSAAYGYGNRYDYGKYGYGYSGYGYAAYDTSAAYAYYASDENESQNSVEADSAASAVNRKRRSAQSSSNKNIAYKDAPPLYDRWRAQLQRFSKWLDT